MRLNWTVGLLGLFLPLQMVVADGLYRFVPNKSLVCENAIANLKPELELTKAGNALNAMAAATTEDHIVKSSISVVSVQLPAKMALDTFVLDYMSQNNDVGNDQPFLTEFSTAEDAARKMARLVDSPIRQMTAMQRSGNHDFYYGRNTPFADHFETILRNFPSTRTTLRMGSVYLPVSVQFIKSDLNAEELIQAAPHFNEHYGTTFKRLSDKDLPGMIRRMDKDNYAPVVQSMTVNKFFFHLQADGIVNILSFKLRSPYGRELGYWPKDVLKYHKALPLKTTPTWSKKSTS